MIIEFIFGWYMSKDEATSTMKDFDLQEKSGTL